MSFFSLRSYPRALLSLAMCFAFASHCAAAENDTRQAIAFYNQQKYAAALQAFTAISDKEPTNSSALYYAANCQIGLGHTTAAIWTYKRLIANFPTSNEASSARTVLQRMGVPGVASVSEKTETEKGNAGKSTADPLSARSSRAPISADAKDRIIDKLVVKVRALADRPEVSESTLYSIKDSLKQYPTPLLGVLFYKGCKIYITPTMIDKDPELVNRKPEGYEDGDTYRNCPGMFNGNIILCEKIFVSDGPDLRKAPDIVGTLRHELGHAVDWYLGDLTAKDDFKHLYLLDLGTMDDDVKNKLAYFCQKDFRGPAETFAELMCFKYGGRPSGSGRTDLVGSSFKLTRSYVDKVINEVDGSKSAHL
jgi:hypothetical protein